MSLRGPLVRACMSPADTYAVEVVLNKPGVSANLKTLKNASNVLLENGTFIFRSHYDRRLYVMLWNGSDGPHVRVQIPVEWESQTVSVASLNVSILVTDEALEKLRSDGWNVVDNTAFERCLRGNGIDPSRVIRTRYFELNVEAVNKPDGEVEASVKDFLGPLEFPATSP